MADNLFSSPYNWIFLAVVAFQLSLAGRPAIVDIDDRMGMDMPNNLVHCACA